MRIQLDPVARLLRFERESSCKMENKSQKEIIAGMNHDELADMVSLSVDPNIGETFRSEISLNFSIYIFLWVSE